jgi:tetratricopeptide (TPR) repeat protein
VATCLNNLAELERLAGRYENAVAGYQQAIAIQLAMHSPGGAVLPRFNLALLYLHTRQFAEALPVLIECRNDLELSGRLVFYGAVQVALLPCYASARDWTAWTACLREAREFGERKVIEPDDAWPVQLAGDLALEAGETARAREAYALALTLWQVVKEESKVAELEAILEKLESAPAGSAPAPAS